MRVISRRRLREFWQRPSCRDAETPLKCWFKEAVTGRWKDPHDIKRRYPSASILPGGRVVFNLGGNKYRLIAAVRYDIGLVFIRFVGTHAEYDRVDARNT